MHVHIYSIQRSLSLLTYTHINIITQLERGIEKEVEMQRERERETERDRKNERERGSPLRKLTVRELNRTGAEKTNQQIQIQIHHTNEKPAEVSPNENVRAIS